MESKPSSETKQPTKEAQHSERCPDPKEPPKIKVGRERWTCDPEILATRLYGRGLETPRARFATDISPPGADKKRHIHFNKEVLQCIAIAKEDKEWLEFGGESSWDESYIVKSASPRAATPPGNFSSENKTIAPLPPTTLKYHGDAPEPQPSSIISCWSWKKYIPGYHPGYQPHSSSFRETLRQSRELLGASSRSWGSSQDTDNSTNSWLVDSAEDDEVAQDFYLASLGFLSQGDRQISNADLLFDRMVDTVNTAKDIAQVI